MNLAPGVKRNFPENASPSSRSNSMKQRWPTLCTVADRSFKLSCPDSLGLRSTRSKKIVQPVEVPLTDRQHCDRVGVAQHHDRLSIARRHGDRSNFEQVSTVALPRTTIPNRPVKLACKSAAKANAAAETIVLFQRKQIEKRASHGYEKAVF